MSVDDDVHDFREYLEDGQHWEGQLKPTLRDQIMDIQVEQIHFEDNPDDQLSGIDLVLAEREFNDIQVKVRDNEYYRYNGEIDIAFEVEHEETKTGEKTDGWIYEFEDYPVILAYCWENKVGDNLADGVLILIDQNFIDWFDAHKEQYQRVRTNKPSYDELTRNKWYTYNRIIDLDSIPSGFKWTRFNPRLPVDKVTNQGKLPGVDGGFCFHSTTPSDQSCPKCGCSFGTQGADG